jgi:arginyl-tRNA synthetase
MSLMQEMRKCAAMAIEEIFDQVVAEEEVLVNVTKPEFEGDYTMVVFNLTSFSKKSPEETASMIGEFLLEEYPEIFISHNVIKGFLNLTIADDYWTDFLGEYYDDFTFGEFLPNSQKVIVEYSSPNTNKPLHLGHLRNNFLGWSIAAILKANGYEVFKTCVVNDRGIHICKSMVAWQLFGNGQTPVSAGMKGDHFVGEYYVKFNEIQKQQVDELVQAGKTKEEAENETPVMKAAKEMLQKWEQNDPVIRELWHTMNEWVYAGFDETYRRIGSEFDKIYYESDTYLLGKKYVEQGVKKGIFTQKKDKSVWVDLTADGLDEKLLLRKDGTSVYITQDIGLAKLKYDDYKAEQSIYVIGDEQIYHMKVLQLVCQKLKIPHADGIFHLSYGMVELPGGKMKSREGTVVDADDMLDEMTATAARHTQELGKVEGFTEDELQELYEILGTGAIKFFLLRVDPKKKMVFNPQESIDFHGFTGPFVQYTFARIKSVLRKEKEANGSYKFLLPTYDEPLLPLEKELLLQLDQYPDMVASAGNSMDPSVIAIYVFTVAKTFNSFYTEYSIQKAETEEKKQLRLQLSMLTAHVLSSGMHLLGISMPERM